MNLVNELQISAERDDVLTVLRKAKRLASKLALSDINHWLRCEQEGYGEGDDVAEYRIVKGSLVYNTNGPIPVGLGMVGSGIMDFPGNFTVDRHMPDSMSEVVTMITDVSERNYGLYYPLDESSVTRQFRGMLHPWVANQVTFLLKINTGQVRAIPEAVKDRILDWACELERRGVLGENMTFNDQEKAKAHSITFNIRDCKIEQLNNTGKNLRRLANG